MKANCFFLTLIITACMLFSACKSNENVNTFSAVIASYNGEKDYMSNRDIFWSEGDMVKINNGSYAVALDESNRNRASIYAEGVTTYSGSYYAAYPAGLADIAVDGTVSFNIPAKQTYSKDGSGRQVARNIMAAKTDDSQFEFSPLGAMLHFSVTSSSADARLCAIEVTADKPVCGAMTATFSGSGWTVSPPATGDNLKRSLVFTTPESIDAIAKDFYLAVMPFDNATSFTLRLVFETASGVVKVYDKTKSGGSISLEKGRMYLFNTSFDGTDVTVADATIHANTMDGTASHPYEVYSQHSWEYAMSSYAGTGSNHIELGGDIEVSASTNVFKASLDGKGHTITLTTDNISLFKQINNGTVQNLTIDAENAFTSPVLEEKKYGSLACDVTGTTSIISNCTNKVAITCYVANVSGYYIGGLLGKADKTSVSGCSNEKNIISNATNIGGIAGELSNTISFTNNTNSGQVTFRTVSNSTQNIKIGGLAGNILGNIIVSNCTNDGNILLDGTTTGIIYCGGIAGQSNSNYNNCGNYSILLCNNNNSNQKIVGGLIGYHNSASYERNMVNCFNEGSIDAANDVNNMFVGGLVSDDQYLNIKNSYAFCSLKGNYVAGLVYGRSQYLNSDMINCYYYGEISATNNAYGLAGQYIVYGDSYKYTITHCFYKNGYTMRYGSNGSDSDNNTIKAADPLTLSNDNSLQATLNAGTAGIDGARGWTISDGHVVLSAE